MQQRLKELRKYLKMSQSDLADKIGVKWYKIKDIETGKTRLHGEIIIALMNELGVNSNWLLNGYGDMFLTIDNSTTNNTVTHNEGENIAINGSSVSVHHNSHVPTVNNDDVSSSKYST